MGHVTHRLLHELAAEVPSLHTASAEVEEKVRCGVLQCVAECCSVLQCAVECRSVVPMHTASAEVEEQVCCSVLQCVAVCRSVSKCVAENVCVCVLQKMFMASAEVEEQATVISHTYMSHDV